MLSAKLLRQREALIALIHDRFGAITREGGMSWSESVVVDGYGTEEERREARAKDDEKHWNELVEDQDWKAFPGVGGFCFLDPIGFRYYFAPAMIRVAKDDGFPLPSLEFHLEQADDSFGYEHFSAFTPEQRNCVAMFIQYMVAFASEALQESPVREAVVETWQSALRPWLNDLSAE